MSLSNLNPAKGSLSSKKRIGRGNASGQGRTAGKGHNGYKSRSGASNKFYFEGGQTPLMRRLPKRGFSNHMFKNSFQIVNLDSLNNIKTKKIDNNVLLDLGLIKKISLPVKILSKGNLDKPLEISANAFSKAAIEKIEKCGGKVIFI
tara:strand:- start:4740 stop:5180 length:441 start_codon:yes stop_codon:yes gene_type:complete